jgi:hypothetical protein
LVCPSSDSNFPQNCRLELSVFLHAFHSASSPFVVQDILLLGYPVPLFNIELGGNAKKLYLR